MEPDVTPILVVVAKGRYQCYGPNTPRSHELTRVLKDTGGVNESVPDGRYNFNVIIVKDEPFATLFPVVE